MQDIEIVPDGAVPGRSQLPPGGLAPTDAESPQRRTPSEARLLAVMEAARFHGIELDRRELRLTPGTAVIAPATLVEWVRGAGLWARADRVKWRDLMRMNTRSPLVLLFADGSAGVLTAINAQRRVVFLRDPTAGAGEPPVAVDEMRLAQVWRGEMLLVRQQRGVTEEEAPFNFMWILQLVLKERVLLRDIGIASLTLSVLTILPPLIVMTVIDRVVVHHSFSTLALISLIILITTIFETVLGYARRELIAVSGARLDTRLTLHVFNRMLGLPLDYFERNPAGQTTHRMYQIYRVREFITGRLLTTFLDLITLFVLLPFLFYISPVLSWMVLATAVLISLIIFCFLRPMRRAIGKVVYAETMKSTVLVESVHGIRTIKSLALEPQQKDQWDAKVADASKARLEAARLANWPQTLVNPLEGFAQRGVLLVGAYLLLTGSADIGIGALIAFMMLGQRVAQPLVSTARLLEDLEEVRGAVGEVAAILNNPSEVSRTGSGLRPRFAGAITFDEVTFTYPGSKAPALKKLSFEVPAGTMLGVVGKSGSGKSTITRLLQGINRTYDGYVKLDGMELREIDLPHLRRSFGVVLQDNFLFRGSVRDNIVAGRPGLTIEDVVRAARLAGAEEFIERMPAGYETFIEEGSANLSGGQRQRLAIARALITDPRLMILDEATSALDPESEALVNANLTRIGRGRTMVVVSHRLSSLTESDLILVLDKGTVVDLAPHLVLVERCAIYRQLWLQQNRHMQPQNQRPTSVGPVLAQGD